MKTSCMRLTVFVLFSFLFACTTSADRKPANVMDPVLNVVSWNVKHLGRKGFNTVVAVTFLKEADIITFQEVNKSASGTLALKGIANRIESETGEKACVAWSETPSNARERYAYIWKDARISFVKVNGEILSSCPASDLVVRLGVKNAHEIVREPAVGQFYFKPLQKKFILASIHLVPSGKSPQKEVAPLFETFRDVEGPVIVAGDYNLDSTHSSFQIARNMGFQAAMVGVKTSMKRSRRELNKPYDNFWFRNVQLRSPGVINLYMMLPQMDATDIYSDLSDHSPIHADFHL